VTGAATPERRELRAGEEEAGLRLDVAIPRLAPDLSRARVHRLIEDGRVLVDGRPAKAAARLRGAERIAVEIPPPEPSGVAPQDLPLSVIHEDRDLLVIDKRAGMVVHPARGTPHSTVVNALLHRLGAGAPGGDRPGLVHRLDKDTSGCLVVARSEAALGDLQAQFRGRSVGKIYLALVHGRLPDAGRLETPYGRHPRDRKRFTGKQGSRRALTAWTVRERFGDRATLAEVTLHTGRTHQIRVHLSEAGHPILADAAYGGARREARLPAGDPVRRAAEAVGRQALHAWRLTFRHPRTGRDRTFEAPLPADLVSALAVLRETPPTGWRGG
jgi:23S rRNA pseudouridine1911/1915/1917 synthase